MMDRPIHVVGGGLAGLVAAVTAAEAGAPVVLHEATDRLGGRALGPADRPGVNLGPHVVFTDGALVAWLSRRAIGVDLRCPILRGVRLVDDHGVHRPIGAILRLGTTMFARRAPMEMSFREWTEGSFGPVRSDLMCRTAGLFSYHHDPGSLSARFVWDRYRRAFGRADRVRWVAGGWSSLIQALADRAVSLGVSLQLEDRIDPASLPDAPTIVATRLSGATRLLERDLSWPGTRTAILDVIARTRPGWPAVVADVRSDLLTCAMVERETATDPDLVGDRGVELFQAQLGIASDVTVATALHRLESSLDQAAPGWRGEAVWSHGQVLANFTGAVDPPGATWRDRPAIDQGDDRFLAGDAVAAPGMLSEVSVNSAVRAAHLALEARRQRAFPVGWPRLDLSVERRFAVLAAVLPNGSLRVDDLSPEPADEAEPAGETGLDYQLNKRAIGLVGRGVIHGEEGDRRAFLVSSHWPPPLGRVAGWFRRIAARMVGS